MLSWKRFWNWISNNNNLADRSNRISINEKKERSHSHFVLTLTLFLVQSIIAKSNFSAEDFVSIKQFWIKIIPQSEKQSESDVKNQSENSFGSLRSPHSFSLWFFVPRTRVELVIPPWKGGVLTDWPTRHFFRLGCKCRAVF